METNCVENKPKHRVIYEYFLDAISKGEFKPGCKLPSERALAKDLSVNVATIRRAVKELVMNGVIEKRVGDGTYLKKKSQELSDEDKNTVNIITSSYDGSVHKEFAEIAIKEAPNYGLIPKLTKLPPINYVSALKLINPEQCMIVLSEENFINGPLAKMLKSTFKHSALIGDRLDSEEVCSVIGDDNYGVRLLIEHLKENGHERIAVLANSLHVPTEKIQVAIWRSLVDESYSEELMINAEVPTAAQPMDYAFKAVKKALKTNDFTALICLNDELALGAMAACRDCGKKLPDDISIASIGNTAMCKYSYPKLTSIDPDLTGHVKKALEIVSKKNEAKNIIDVLQVIKPILVKRDSVKNIKK